MTIDHLQLASPQEPPRELAQPPVAAAADHDPPLRDVFVHLGYPRTGTTWLQRYVFPHHPRIRYVEPTVLSRVVVDPHDFEFEPQQARTALIDAAHPAEEDRILGLSNERLVGALVYGGADSKRNADRLHAMFPGAKIIICLRNQWEMLVSVYKRYVFRGGVGSLEKFLYPKRLPYGVPHFSLQYLQYGRLVGHYQSLFGERNVHVYTFEEFARDQRRTLDELSAFLGIAPWEIGEFQSARPAPSLSSRWAIRLFRVLNPLFVGHHRPAAPVQKLGIEWRNRLLEWDQTWVGRLGGRFRPRGDLKQKIEDFYRPTNRETARRTGLDLQGLGYPM